MRAVVLWDCSINSSPTDRCHLTPTQKPQSRCVRIVKSRGLLSGFAPHASPRLSTEILPNGFAAAAAAASSSHIVFLLILPPILR